MTQPRAAWDSHGVIFAILAALSIAWLLYAVFENGPTWPGMAIAVLVVWALVDYGA